MTANNNTNNNSIGIFGKVYTFVSNNKILTRVGFDPVTNYA